MIPEPAESEVGFEAPQAIAPADAPVLQLGAYEGPLDLLLALAPVQRVDLTRISMVALADAFVARLEAAIATRRLPLAVFRRLAGHGGHAVGAPGPAVAAARHPVNRETEQEAAALRRRLSTNGIHFKTNHLWREPAADC